MLLLLFTRRNSPVGVAKPKCNRASFQLPHILHHSQFFLFSQFLDGFIPFGRFPIAFDQFLKTKTSKLGGYPRIDARKEMSNECREDGKEGMAERKRRKIKENLPKIDKWKEKSDGSVTGRGGKGREKEKLPSEIVAPTKPWNAIDSGTRST